MQRLKAFAPHLVVATEIGAAEIAAIAKRGGFFTAPILAVQTDFHTEPPWVQPEIDVHCVASREAKSQLISWGVSSNRILQCGIPIDPAFALPFDREELLQALGLDPRRPMVLAMGGGMGPIPMGEIVQSLVLSGLWHILPLGERLCFGDGQAEILGRYLKSQLFSVASEIIGFLLKLGQLGDRVHVAGGAGHSSIELEFRAALPTRKVDIDFALAERQPLVGDILHEAHQPVIHLCPAAA